MTHPLEPCLSMSYDKQGRTQGLISMHVDDLLITGCPKKFVQQVEVSNVEEHHHWQDRASCCQLRRTDPCVRNTECHWVLLSPSRRSRRFQFRAMPKITTRRALARSGCCEDSVGALRWPATQRAPHLGCSVFMLQGTVTNATIIDLRAANKVLRCAKTQKDVTGVVDTTRTSWRSVTQHGLPETTETVDEVIL